MTEFPPFLLDDDTRAYSSFDARCCPAAMAMLMVGTVPASAVVGTANTVMYYPIVVRQPCRVLRYAWFNGATLNGNVNMCLTDINGIVVANSVLGSTLQAGASAIQVPTDLATPPVLKPGNYFLSFVTSSTTATFWRFAPGAVTMRTTGCQQMASNFALGNATFANPTINHIASCAAIVQKVT